MTSQEATQQIKQGYQDPTVGSARVNKMVALLKMRSCGPTNSQSGVVYSAAGRSLANH